MAKLFPNYTCIKTQVCQPNHTKVILSVAFNNALSFLAITASTCILVFEFPATLWEEILGCTADNKVQDGIAGITCKYTYEDLPAKLNLGIKLSFLDEENRERQG